MGFERNRGGFRIQCTCQGWLYDLPNALLDSIDLSGLENKGVNFQNAQLNGSIFTGSDYSDSNFSGAFFKEANLIGGKFNGSGF